MRVAIHDRGDLPCYARLIVRSIAYLAFFVSGLAALLYQVSWQRILVMFAGSDVHAATIVVAAFMAGLGLGSLGGGWLADRRTPRRCLLLFAIAEVAIGVFGLASEGLYYDVLYSRLGAADAGMAMRAAVLFISLLPPTVCMGLSLPLLARTLTREIADAPVITAWLYGANTIGAAAGAWLTTWHLLPQLGVDGALRIAAVLNLGAGAAALALLGFGVAREEHVRPPAPSPRRRRPAARAMPAERTDIPRWLALSAMSGFLALSFEIVWFRLLGIMQKSTTATFGTLLTIYLIGLGVGAVGGSALVRFARQPGRVFGWLIAASGVMGGLGVVVLMMILARAETVPWLWTHVSGYEPLNVQTATGSVGSTIGAEFWWLYVWIPALLIAPSTTLMGAAFPFLQRTVQTDLAHVGSRVGWLLAANIAGSVAGAMLTGWLLLGAIGTAGTLRLLVVASACFPILAGWTARVPIRGAGLAAAAAGMALAVALPGPDRLWARLHGANEPLIMAEDGSGTSVLKPVMANGQPAVVVYVNGLGQSWLPFGGVHTTLGALPAFVHPHPRRAAVIGLGSGDTVFGLAGRPEIEQVVCIEIVRPQIDTLQRLHATHPYPGLATVLRDPRVVHVYGDGRQYLLRSADRFDVIEADALRPTSAFAGLLYSDAYFRLIKDRLNPGGFAVTWAPTDRVRDTVVSVFPHVVSIGEIVMASNEPIALDPVAIESRIAGNAVRSYFSRAGIDVSALLAPYLTAPAIRIGPEFDRSTIIDINTDLYPRDEFGVPRRAGR